MEASHEDKHGLPNAQAFAYLLCTRARFPRRWVVAVLLGKDKGGNRTIRNITLQKWERAEQLQNLRRIKTKNWVCIVLNILALHTP
jgi:hypothetical protein